MKATLKQITAFVAQYGDERTYDRALEAMGSFAATTAYTEVKKSYEAFAATSGPSSPFGERTYELGKREGDGGPARPPSKPGDTLRELGSFVRVHRSGLSASQMGSMGMAKHRASSFTKGADFAYIVDIDPTARVSKTNWRFKTGIPARLMAYWTEWPKPVQINETQRMLGYVMTIRRNKLGFGSPIKGPRKPSASFANSDVIAIKPRAKPVWNTAQQRLPSKARAGLRQRSIIKLQKGPLRKAMGGAVESGFHKG